MTGPHEISSSIGSTSSSLLQHVKNQDQEAWRRLVRLYGPLVDAWVARARLQAADAEDIFQAVFQAVAGNVGSFEKIRPSGSFRAWLRTITKNKLIDHHRRLQGQPQAAGGADALQWLLELAEELSESAGDRDEADDLQALRRKALEMIRSEFEAKTWEAFCVVVEGHEVKEVAGELGITPSAVRLFKSRILHRLREEMEGLEP